MNAMYSEEVLHAHGVDTTHIPETTPLLKNPLWTDEANADLRAEMERCLRRVSNECAGR